MPAAAERRRCLEMCLAHGRIRVHASRGADEGEAVCLAGAVVRPAKAEAAARPKAG